MRILPDIWLVGSGRQGFSLTDDVDCHVYLVDCGGSSVLIDAGSGIAPELIEAQITATGVDPARLSHLFLTHGHADHSGGAAYLQRRYGCQVVASPAVARMIRGGEVAAIALDLALAAGIYPPDYHWERCAVDRVVEDGDSITVDDREFIALATPGHAVGHLSFLLTTPHGRVIFAGDTVFQGGEILLQATPDCSIWDYRQTVARLATLEVDVLLPGHRSIVLQRASSHIRQAEEAFARLLPPRNLL